MSTPEGGNGSNIRPEMAFLDLDTVRLLALEMGAKFLNGKNLHTVQATLVLAWLMSTGELNEIPTMDERMARASVFIQEGTTALASAVMRVMKMTEGEIRGRIGTDLTRKAN